MSKSARKCLIADAGFCGSYKSTIDSKWRLKIPSEFRGYLLENYGDLFYLATIDGESLLVFPTKTWEDLKKESKTNANLASIMLKLSIGVRPSKMDSQGKIIIPEALRVINKNLRGTVFVVAVVDHLQVFTLEALQKHFEQTKISNEEFLKIRAGG